MDSQEGLLSSRGGGGGTRLTVPPSGTVLGHSQGFLQCHFSRCKVGSFKGLRVRIVLVDAFTRSIVSIKACVPCS